MLIEDGDGRGVVPLASLVVAHSQIHITKFLCTHRLSSRVRVRVRVRDAVAEREGLAPMRS
jgi:hypothetical protein